ncbi:MAG: phosphatidate cytidylyltransferase [Solirubrobacteraceae bacterium]|nr:phosphatidate cytidylyltransferase [Solirubrobacteraceae bacterium]
MSGSPRTGRQRRDRDRTPRPAEPPREAPAKAPKKQSELMARIAVAIPALAFALLIVGLGGWWFTAGAAALAIICAHEFFRMYEPIHPVRMGGFIGIIALCIAAQTGGREHLSLVVVVSFLIVFLLSFAQVKTTAVGVAMTIFALTWIGLGVAHAIMLRNLDNGADVLIDVLVGTFVGDTAAYLGGRAVGRTKLSPAISPNKTVEGLLIGIAAAVFAVWVAGLYQDWMTGWDSIILGVVVALVSPIGDLFESYFKREAQTKDTGTLFGAHGGALDRLDAVLFTTVAGYYTWLWLR